VTTECTFRESATAVRVSLRLRAHRRAGHAEHLCVEALTLEVDRLSALARQLQDEIDETGIADREKGRHAKRSLRVVKQAEGMTRLVWMMDPDGHTQTDKLDSAGTPHDVAREHRPNTKQQRMHSRSRALTEPHQKTTGKTGERETAAPESHNRPGGGTASNPPMS